MSSQKSVFGTGVQFSGTLSPARSIEIHGRINADITADKLVIGPSGQLDGKVEAGLGVIEGRYNGQMTAKSVWLMSSARLSGEIEYSALQMDRGAALNCRIKHNWDDEDTSELAEGQGR